MTQSETWQAEQDDLLLADDRAQSQRPTLAQLEAEVSEVMDEWRADRAHLAPRDTEPLAGWTREWDR